ncbi:putative methyltransferase-domain-containing protein [Mycena olivaceomarginata]|nr:putative methyltransferase-domain-containing protein [Mycena olivaceomarginata]
MHLNPNFPQNLDIRPSVPSEDDLDEIFDFNHQREAIRVFGIAGKVWKVDALPDQIFDPPLFPHPEARKNARMLELGSGTGIVAATMAAMLHANDILFVTDLPEVCPLLEQNLQGSLDGPIRVRPLSWGNSQHALSIADELSKLQDTPYLTHILCSDLVYFPELLAPLLRSLIQLSSPPFISRQPKTPFWSAFGLWFEFAPVLVKTSPSGSWQRFGVSLEDPTFVFVARRREESFDWQVPPRTPLPKGDDTFETLLLMSLNVSDEI